jgi:TPP-dependent pyruvate/acetoin dehydrogenase alpha subunit
VSRIGDGELARLFFQMARMRQLEMQLGSLWQQGRISGELHLGIGEEAAVAGVVDHLVEGDSLALDHRSTPPLVARGADLTALVLELLGSPEGLCGGMGGHMHLFDPARLAASSGIVGATGPMGCGFGLAAAHLRPGRVAVAFFGEGAANQGMLMESLNLASVWALPVVFVCKDNRLAVTTRSHTVTAGRLARRAASFGIPATRVSGADVGAVWHAAARAVSRARAGRRPAFLHVRCWRPEGHFLGDPLIRAVREPVTTGGEFAPGLLRALTAHPGAALRERARGAGALLPPMVIAGAAARLRLGDPLARARHRLGARTADRIQGQADEEVTAAVRAALARAEVARWPA